MSCQIRSDETLSASRIPRINREGPPRYTNRTNASTSAEEAPDPPRKYSRSQCFESQFSLVGSQKGIINGRDLLARKMPGFLSIDPRVALVVAATGCTFWSGEGIVSSSKKQILWLWSRASAYALSMYTSIRVRLKVMRARGVI